MGCGCGGSCGGNCSGNGTRCACSDAGCQTALEERVYREFKVYSYPTAQARARATEPDHYPGFSIPTHSVDSAEGLPPSFGGFAFEAPQREGPTTGSSNHLPTLRILGGDVVAINQAGFLKPIYYPPTLFTSSNPYKEDKAKYDACMARIAVIEPAFIDACVKEEILLYLAFTTPMRVTGMVVLDAGLVWLAKRASLAGGLSGCSLNVVRGGILMNALDLKLIAR